MKQLVKTSQVDSKNCLILNQECSGNPLLKSSKNYRKTNGRYNNRNTQQNQLPIKTSIPSKNGYAHVEERQDRQDSKKKKKKEEDLQLDEIQNTLHM